VLVGAAAAQKLHYIEADALGTPRVVVDPTRGASGTAIWTWDLNGEAFGTTAPNQNPDGDANQFVFNLRFPGQRFDSASGLNYNYQRDGYEAGTGRYHQPDPIGLRGGMSIYGYVGSKPLMWIDPLGLDGGPWTYPPGPMRDDYFANIGRTGLIGLYESYRTWRIWGHNKFPGEKNSFARHCTVSCIMSKKNGEHFTWATGVFNEYQGFYRHDIWDLQRRFNRVRPWAFNPDDLSANEKGFDCADKQNCLMVGGDETSIVAECTKCCELGVMYGY
jgi:RHS repeat-associated protein